MSQTGHQKYQRARDVTVIGLIFSSIACGMIVMCMLPQVQVALGASFQKFVILITSSYLAGVALMILPQLYVRKNFRQSVAR